VRGKWGKKFSSSGRAWGWPESKKDGMEMMVRRRTEPMRRGPEWWWRSDGWSVGR
jgi:hypothetical protein